MRQTNLRKVKSFSNLQKTKSFEDFRSLLLYSKLKRSKSFEKNKYTKLDTKDYEINEERFPLSFSYMTPSVFTKKDRLTKLYNFFSKR